jgi:hypothetical protein
MRILHALHPYSNQLARMSSMLPPKPHYLISTDPSYVVNPIAYKELLNDKPLPEKTVPIGIKLPLPFNPQVKTFTPIPITETLFKTLNNMNEAQPESTKHTFDAIVGNESVYSFGEKSKSLLDYELIGCHGSDSRMVCLIPSDPFSNNNNSSNLEVDWNDFAMTSLQYPSTQVNREDFPLYLFFSPIPEEDTCVAIFGLVEPNQANIKIYRGIIIRSYELSIMPESQNSLDIS